MEADRIPRKVKNARVHSKAFPVSIKRSAFVFALIKRPNIRKINNLMRILIAHKNRRLPSIWGPNH